MQAMTLIATGTKAAFKGRRLTVAAKSALHVEIAEIVGPGDLPVNLNQFPLVQYT